MHIQWFGQSCFKLSNKSNGNDITIITDPFSSDLGLKQPKLQADIVTISHSHKDHSFTKLIKNPTENTKPFLISSPGEYEIKDTFIYGIKSFHDSENGTKLGNNIIYTITLDGIKIAHLGDIGQKELTDEQLEMMNNVDILLIPIGGKETIGTEEATKIISQIEPRIIIPMHYKIPGIKKDLQDNTNFIKEIGIIAEQENKLKITKKDLPQEETRLVILETT